MMDFMYVKCKWTTSVDAASGSPQERFLLRRKVHVFMITTGPRAAPTAVTADSSLWG
ncbi:hypothetical protein GBF38_002837, partial [Nibea albiflora]